MHSHFVGFVERWFIFTCDLSKHIHTLEILIRKKILEFTIFGGIGLGKQSDQIRVYTVCHSVCIFWTHFSMEESDLSNFRIITAIFVCQNI